MRIACVIGMLVASWMLAVTSQTIYDGNGEVHNLKSFASIAASLMLLAGTLVVGNWEWLTK